MHCPIDLSLGFSQVAGAFFITASNLTVGERAERRAGELLKNMADHGERETKGGDRKSKSRPVTSISKLSDLNINGSQSSPVA